MPITPTCEPSQQLPPPVVQGQLQRIWQVSGATQSALLVHAAVPLGVQILVARVAGATQSALVVHGVAKSSEQTAPQQFPFPFPSLPLPNGHSEVGVPTPPVTQSREEPVGLVLVQAIPARGPRSQVPVNGGVPSGRHFGHGWPRLPVM